MSTTSETKKPQVEYRRLGKSGLRVSVPIIGAMSYGSKRWMPWVLEEEEALPLLKAAWDRGVNTIDTANQYSGGVSEQIVGKFIKKYNIPREKILILTKCFFPAPEDPSIQVWMHPELRDEQAYVNNCGLSRGAIFNQVEASLKRLDTPYIDLLQIHRFDYETPIEETMEALHDLVKSGKVRYIGGSSMWAWQFALMNSTAEKHGWTQFVSMQNMYNLMYREEEREMNAYCNHKGIGLIPWGPLASGFLARPSGKQTTRSGDDPNKIYGRDITKSEFVIIDRVEELAKKKGWPMSQVALAWLNSKITSPIIGISSVARLEESIIPDKKLSDEETKFLEEPYVPTAVFGHF
ncbi:Aldo/keto reductase [Sistotremastrum suecicum HHB10207 ss-3]|uniref:Aldo/keto reductase n=1 Tax=Sistotremastrum suecicum HHB10207 ss-3 TaxID=1314776 RepID=A0A166GDK0_9AGAM|nr:Aldo/keto reductase [Sistotremastrum suecicum HHB10207 ss-3]